MTNCGKISKNLILAGCKSSTPAIEPDMILINFEDWKKATVEEADGVVSGLTLTAGANGYEYKGAKNSFERSCTLSKGTYVNTFDHKVLCRVFKKTQAIKDEINKLKESKVVAIVKNVNTGEDEVVWELLGADNGLEMSELTEDATASDGIIYQFSLASGDNFKESELPKTVDAGTAETTEALIKALVKQD